MKSFKKYVVLYLIGVCLLIAGILLYSNLFSPSGIVTRKTNEVINEYLPKVQSFLTENQTILDDILYRWMSYLTKQEVDILSQPLNYMVFSKENMGISDNEMLSAEISDEFVQKLKQIEGDATENIVITFISDGIIINFGRFPYTDIIIFSSKRWGNKYVPDEESVFKLENDWTVAFIGVARG